MYALFTVCFGTLVLHNQIQLMRVLRSGVPAHATVDAIIDGCNKSDSGVIALHFTDTSGRVHAVKYATLGLNGCNVKFRVGEDVRIRYLPDDSSVLVTQPELDSLTETFVLYGLMDLFLLALVTVPVLALVLFVFPRWRLGISSRTNR